MKDKILLMVSVLLTLLVLLLAGCGDSDETKSQKLLTDAEIQMQQGDEAKAEALFADLITKYPNTQSGVRARQYLQSIVEKRALLLNKKFAKILDSYRQVFEGYLAVYAKYPRTIAELDQSDYFFDSTYLQEITPEGYQVYLRLTADGSAYTLWCVAKDQERGYRAMAANEKFFVFDRTPTLNELKASFRAESWDDKVVILQE